MAHITDNRSGGIMLPHDAEGALPEGRGIITADDTTLRQTIHDTNIRLARVNNKRTVVGFTPILDRVLVMEIKTEAQAKLVLRGGFKLDLRAQDERESLIGQVVGIGDGVATGGVLMPIPVKIGDIVRYGRYGKEEIILRPEDEFDSEAPDYFLIRCADLKGIIDA